ncbi:MAG: hypothetical protein N2745_10725 [Syntrophorhabdaceae bacterium]|nr:hypothetical protein [Syntrophorhabdaceae bacterium]
MAKFSHDFVETYRGLEGFGFDRDTDENTVRLYLQRFSDDKMMELILKRLEEDELSQLFEMISRLLVKYLTEEEYHTLFLRDK